MATAPSASSPAPRSPSLFVLLGAVIGTTVAIIALVAPHALLVIVVELVAALVVVMPPVLAGLWLVPEAMHFQLPWRWRLLLGTALGLGATSLLVLLFGLAGLLHRSLWLAVHVGMAGAGAIRLRRLLRAKPGAQPVAVVSGDASVMRRASRGHHWSSPWQNPSWLWLATAPFLAAALLAASLAPGLIWTEEGFGYDVLEYHLQMPREYFETGRIAYAPHNVYANFPAGVEMFYLLAMIVQGASVDAAVTANMIHLLFAVGTVLAAAAAGRDHSPLGGVVAGVTAGSSLWLVYLSGLAYVENAMLFFGVCAAGLLMRISTSPRAAGAATAGRLSASSDRPLPGFRIAWLSGVLGGLACGCKYTALPLIAVPLGLLASLLPAASQRVRAVRVLLVGIGVTSSFSPWLVKNVAMTGSPVFPLANGILDVHPPGWSDESAYRWQAGHRPAKADSSLPSRAVLLWQRTLGDPLQRLSWPIAVVAMLALFARNTRRENGLLGLLLIVQVLLWGGLTHLYARFAVVFLIPLLLLAGRAIDEKAPSRHRSLVLGLLFLGVVWNATFTWTLLRAEAPGGVFGGVPASVLHAGHVPGYEHHRVANELLPPGRRLLLLGESRAFYFDSPVDYTVVFNDSPLAAAVRSAAPADRPRSVLRWLREQRYTHVLVNWAEIRRLRASAYGFPEEITSDLFDELIAIGLRLETESLLPGRNEPYVTVFTVPQGG